MFLKGANMYQIYSILITTRPKKDSGLASRKVCHVVCCSCPPEPLRCGVAKWSPLCWEGGGHCIEDTGHWLIIEMFVSDSSPLGLAPTTQIRSTTTQ